MRIPVDPDVTAEGESENPRGSRPFPTEEATGEALSVSEDVRASLERLLASEHIGRAPRLHAVLKFMIDSLVAGTTATINEQTIGESVFHRPSGYNPAEDNIVRVTIRHLRDRIEEFYRTEGRDEKYIFKIPKGRYTPSLIHRQDEPLKASTNQPSDATPAPQPLSETRATTLAQAPRSPGAAARTLPWVLAGLLGIAAVVLGTLLLRQGGTRPAPRPNDLLSLLLSNGRPTTVVTTDSNLEAYRMMFRKTVPLSDYIGRSYLRAPAQFAGNPLTFGAWTYINGNPQTSQTSMIVASQIQASAAPEEIEIKSPRDLRMRDIKHGNYIFLGGPWIDPWEQLFEDRLNFRIVPPLHEPWMSSIHNLKPRGSEPALFSEHEVGALKVDYVRLALLRSQDQDGGIVLLGGTSDAAIEAGATYLMSEARMKELMNTFHVSAADELPSLEVVIEASGLQGVPESSRVIAERAINPSQN